MEPDFVLFAGTASSELGGAIAAELGVGLGACSIERFPDGELSVRLAEPVRRREVFLVQSTAPPVNEHLLELLTVTDACRRSAATRITAVVPYFGYARSDKRHARREPITASLVARLMEAAGVDHVITLDLHASQIEGFFHIPVDSLTAVPVICRALGERLPASVAVVSPDTGRVGMATEYAHRLGAPVVVLHKRRLSSTETDVTHVVGDVRDRPCLIIDDMISTGGTIARAVDGLLAAGALPRIIVAATHGVFVGEALVKLSHEAIRDVFVTDSVALSDRLREHLHVVSVARLIAGAIRRLCTDRSFVDMD